MSVKEDRIELGVDIINSMSHNGAFPFSNKKILTDTMMEYYISEDFEERLVTYGSTWRPSNNYWWNKFDDIRDTMSETKKIYLQFVRNTGSFGGGGVWKFVKKAEFEKGRAMVHKGIETRIKNHNKIIDYAKAKWQLPNTPKINILLPFDEFAE